MIAHKTILNIHGQITQSIYWGGNLHICWESSYLLEFDKLNWTTHVSKVYKVTKGPARSYFCYFVRFFIIKEAASTEMEVNQGK